MIRFELLKDAGVLVIAPQGALSGEDFREMSRAIDPYIRDKGKLTGLLIEAQVLDGTASVRSLNISSSCTITIATSTASPPLRTAPS